MSTFELEEEQRPSVSKPDADVDLRADTDDIEVLDGDRSPAVDDPPTSETWHRPLSSEQMSVPELGRILTAMAVVVCIGALIGAVLGNSRDRDAVARTEFVYTLDESLPDAFLREDRRILTQVVTLESDAVLSPVADEFGMSPRELRSAVNVSIVELSEVIRLEVADADLGRAIALTERIVDEYLRLSADALPVDSDGLDDRAAALNAELAELEVVADQRTEVQLEDVALAAREQTVADQVDRLDERIRELDRQSSDPDLPLSIRVGAAEERESEAAARDDLIAELEGVRVRRGEIEIGLARPDATLRRIETVRTSLEAVEREQAERALRGATAAPIRILMPPAERIDPPLDPAIQWAAAGALIALIPALLVGRIVRRRQIQLRRTS